MPPTKITVPSAAALIGVPTGARMSIPSGWLGPKYEVMMSLVGQMKLNSELVDGAAATARAGAGVAVGAGRTATAGLATTRPPGTRIVESA